MRERERERLQKPTESKKMKTKHGKVTGRERGRGTQTAEELAGRLRRSDAWVICNGVGGTANRSHLAAPHPSADLACGRCPLPGGMLGMVSNKSRKEYIPASKPWPVLSHL